MRFLTLAAAVLAMAAAQPASAPVPVAVELFTSEGCSSCPPADALLGRLGREQPIAGARVVPLGFHVTYWDQLGWKDPASLAAATERQQDYSRVFGDDRVYTPQAVIDGREEMVGSDEAAVRKAILRAAARPHARVGIRAQADGNSLTGEVTVADLPQDASEKLRFVAIVTEDDLTSIVKRGENGGRTLRHDAVVRLLFGGDLGPSKTVVSLRADLRPAWRRDRLRVVALVQGTRTQRIYGAADTLLR